MKRLLLALSLVLIGCSNGPNATGTLQVAMPATPAATNYRMEQYPLSGNGPAKTVDYGPEITSIDVTNLPIGQYLIVITAERVGYSQHNVTIKDGETTQLTISQFTPGVPGGGNATNSTTTFSVPNFDSTQAATLVDVFAPDANEAAAANLTITLGTPANVTASPSPGGLPAPPPPPALPSAFPSPSPSPAAGDVQRCISPDEMAKFEVKARASRVQRSFQGLPKYQEIPAGGSASFFIVTTSKTVPTLKMNEDSQTLHCSIFAEVVNGSPVISADTARAIATAVDTNNPFRAGSGIYERTQQLFGKEWLANPTGGRDGDTKINLVILSAASIGGENLFGFFRPADEETGANSNQGEILYLNASKFSGDMYDGLATIAHEYQHMINYNQKFIRDGAFPKKVEDVTLDEGFSVNSEDLNGYNLASQGGGNSFIFGTVRSYLASPATQSFFVFNNAQADYGAGYLYIRYLWNRLGEAILFQLVTSPNVGRSNISDVTQIPFPQSFQDWAVTNQISGLAGTPPTNLKYTEGFTTRGTYTIRGSGSQTLNGPTPASSVSNLTPASNNVSLPAWAVRYTRYTGGTGATLNLNLDGDSRIKNNLILESPSGTFSSLQP